MLTLVLNPGGTARIVKIVDALLYLGVDINRPHHCPEMTPEEETDATEALLLDQDTVCGAVAGRTSAESVSEPPTKRVELEPSISTLATVLVSTTSTVRTV